MADDARLLGLSEVAELLRASKQVVGNWRQRRDDFPKPIAELKSGPIWRHDEVVAWAATAGIEVASLGDAGTTRASNGSCAAVAISNMKGGVGKSTLAANLAWFCAHQKNQRVLLVDLDPQFNLSQYVLGTSAYETHVNAGKGTVLDIFEQNTPKASSGSAHTKTRVTAAQVTAHVKSWSDGSLIDLIPASLTLAFTLRNPSQKEHLLANFLDEVRSSYDVVLLDCPPTESMLTTAAYLASESVLIPVKPEFLSTIGLPLMMSSLTDFEDSYKHSVNVLGVVFNMTMDKGEHDRSRAYVRKLANQHNWHVFKNEISHSDSYPKGSRSGKPIFLTDYARSWKIADFLATAEEFYGRLPS